MMMMMMMMMMMKPTATACWMCAFLLGHVVHGDVIMSSTSFGARHLQTSKFRATYRADFQHFRDVVCIADPPVLQVSCNGTEMTILNVSDASIACAQLDEAIITNGTTYQCNNTCTSCASVYENSGDIADGPFASIDFMCEGDNVEQVDAEYVYTNGNDGSCTFASSGQSRNFHVGRLGVLCPTESAGTGAYGYDDTYIQCKFYGAESIGFAIDTAEENADDLYTCVAGDNCEGIECEVPFDEMRFDPILSNLMECIQTFDSAGYNVQFEASWARLLDGISTEASCSSTNPSVLISCGATGSATIQFVNATDTSTLCILLSDNELSCSSSTSVIANNFTSVIYVSIVDAFNLYQI